MLEGLYTNSFLTDFQLAITAGEEFVETTQVQPECLLDASSESGIPMYLISGILKKEAGYPGHIRSNPNKTNDVGPMQINSPNFEEFYKKYGVSPIDIRYNGCVNLFVGTKHLKNKILEKKHEIKDWNSIISVAATYHSKTPNLRSKYANDLKNVSSKMLSDSTEHFKGAPELLIADYLLSKSLVIKNPPRKISIQCLRKMGMPENELFFSQKIFDLVKGFTKGISKSSRTGIHGIPDGLLYPIFMRSGITPLEILKDHCKSAKAILSLTSNKSITRKTLKSIPSVLYFDSKTQDRFVKYLDKKLK